MFTMYIYIYIIYFNINKTNCVCDTQSYTSIYRAIVFREKCPQLHLLLM